MDNSLTFAEAMALDPSEVECDRHAGGEWKPLSDWLGISILAARETARFRRARPKRSRVQEMAEAYSGDFNHRSKTFADAMTGAVRAVCEYLEKREATDFRDRSFCKDIDETIAGDIERHFLGPR